MNRVHSVEEALDLPGEMVTLVLGLGNALMGDDAVGLLILAELSQRVPPADMVLVEAGTSSWALVPLLARSRSVVALDAVRGGGEPGTVYDFPLQAIGCGPTPLSSHDLGLAEAVAMAGLLGSRPVTRVLGIEPASVEPGAISAPVRAAIPRVLRTLTEGWSK